RHTRFSRDWSSDVCSSDLPMALTAEEQRALSVGTDSEGGFAVPFQLDPIIILTNDGSISPLRQIARVEQITTKTWQGVTSSGIKIGRASCRERGQMAGEGG